MSIFPLRLRDTRLSPIIPSPFLQVFAPSVILLRISVFELHPHISLHMIVSLLQVLPIHMYFQLFPTLSHPQYLLPPLSPNLLSVHICRTYLYTFSAVLGNLLPHPLLLRDHLRTIVFRVCLSYQSFCLSVPPLRLKKQCAQDAPLCQANIYFELTRHSLSTLFADVIVITVNDQTSNLLTRRILGTVCLRPPGNKCLHHYTSWLLLFVINTYCPSTHLCNILFVLKILHCEIGSRSRHTPWTLKKPTKHV